MLQSTLFSPHFAGPRFEAVPGPGGCERPTHLIMEAELNAISSHGSSFFLVPFVLRLKHYEELLPKHSGTSMHTCRFSKPASCQATRELGPFCFWGRKPSRGVGFTERISPKQIISGEVVG